MEPFSIATALQIAGTAFSVIGAINDASSRADVRESEAAWRTYNATIERQNAGAALQQSASEQARQNRHARQVLGQQRAATAQSGTGFSGSNLDMLDQSATLAELDMLNIAYEGEIRARGHEIQAQGQDWSAQTERSTARNVRRAGIFSAGRSLLTGFGGMRGGGGGGGFADHPGAGYAGVW